MQRKKIKVKFHNGSIAKKVRVQVIGSVFRISGDDESHKKLWNRFNKSSCGIYVHLPKLQCSYT